MQWAVYTSFQLVGFMCILFPEVNQMTHFH